MQWWQHVDVDRYDNIYLLFIYRAGCDINQIMTSVSILSCFMPFLAYGGNEIRPLALFLSLYARKGIKQDRINTLVSICILVNDPSNLLVPKAEAKGY